MLEVTERRDDALTQSEIAEIVSLVSSTWPKRGTTVPELVQAFPARQRHRRVSCPGSTRPSLRHLVWDHGTLVAHALSFERLVLSEAGEIPVMALSGVCVTPSYRGKGLGAEVARRTFGRVDQGEFPVSLFQTGVREFYRRLGAIVVGNRFIDSRNRLAPDANPWNDKWIMIYPGNYAWPEGPIDLNGPGY